MSRRLYVGNLSFDINEDKLREVFAQVGGVERAEIMKDRWSGVSRGFGFVDMITEEDALCAIAELNGTDAMGRLMRVAVAKPKDCVPIEREQ